MRLAAVKGGDEGDTISILEVVLDGIFELPVDIIDKDEDAWAEGVTEDEHVVARGDEMVLDPGDEVAQTGD